MKYIPRLMKDNPRLTLARANTAFVTLLLLLFAAAPPARSQTEIDV